MTRDEIIEKLKSREADLRAQGVAHVALFGSVARGEDRPDSDIDILVDLDPAIVVTIFDYAGVKDFIADMFDRPVDVVSSESLKPRVRPKAAADAIYASETDRDSARIRLRALPGGRANILRDHALPRDHLRSIATPGCRNEGAPP
jgi:uncharacterized protein